MRNRDYGLIRLVTALALITIFSLGYAQCIFHKVYDGKMQNDYAYDLMEDTDGALISCGVVISVFFVIKTTPCNGLKLDTSEAFSKKK